MKIIKVVYHDFESKPITLGYFTEDYAIEPVISKLLNAMKDSDRSYVSVKKITLNEYYLDEVAMQYRKDRAQLLHSNLGW